MIASSLSLIDWCSHTAHKYLEISGTILTRLRYGTRLTDNRAEIIKIEHPTKGDDTRHWGPPYAKYVEGSDRSGNGESAYFIAVRPPTFRFRHGQLLTSC